MLPKMRDAGIKVYAAVAEPKETEKRRREPPLLRPWEIDWKSPVSLLIGNEGAGLPGEIVSAADARVCIPQVAKANPAGLESLNAAMAATVLLYEALRQRGFQR